MNKPDFIGIGAQKCATSWMHELLNAHDQVFTSDPKEIDFFSYYFDRGYEWYERHFAEAGPGLVRGETSPSYFYNPAVPARVRAYHPDIKIIVILRDPVERAYSNHLHEVRAGHLTGDLSFAAGLRNNPAYIEQGRYATHLARWLKCFPQDQIKLLTFEEIMQDKARHADELCAFMGVSGGLSEELLNRRSNESVGHKSKGLQSIVGAGGHLLRRAGFAGPLERFKQIGAIDYLLGLNKVHLRDTVPAMRDEDRQACIDLLSSEVRELCTILDCEWLPWKNFFQV